MLDRLQLAAALRQVSDKLFPDLTDTTELAWKIYQQIARDETFAQRAAEAQSSFLVPSWRGNLLDTRQYGDGWILKHPASSSGQDGTQDHHSVLSPGIDKQDKPVIPDSCSSEALQRPIRDPALGAQSAQSSYTVIAVDGSQIYPDRHVGGAGCFLINVGGVTLCYDQKSSVNFFSTPRICLPEEILKIDEKLPFSAELVDLMREDDELRVAFERARAVHDQQPIVLVDGTIIFWNLEGKTPEVRRIFLQRYLQHLQSLYEARIPTAGYISLPKSRELVNLVKLGLCRFTTANCIPCHATYDTFPCKQVDALIDTSLVRNFLQPGQRTTLFASSSTIVSEYPAHLRPLFCYLHVGAEIVRLEVPAWVADDDTALDRICAVVLDQSEKGGGYPVCLAEAHEQAVVKGADREFFFSLIARIGMGKNKRMVASQKSIKKRGMGV